MSSFDYDCFYGEVEVWIGFNAEKYTEEQALEVAKVELADGFEPEVDKNLLVVEPAWIRYGFGLNLEDERVNGWWLEFEPKGNSIKAWAVKKVREGR